MRTLFELIAIRLERSEEHLEWMGKERQIAIDSAARTRNAASARINASRDG
ncbi:MAG TPA: hypothetical protein VFR68_03435 [Candidatus Dormibacteraeota bacterium]|nr:hypothetical protein [Candidatus Dormibacteraeota bacterium]